MPVLSALRPQSSLSKYHVSSNEMFGLRVKNLNILIDVPNGRLNLIPLREFLKNTGMLSRLIGAMLSTAASFPILPRLLVTKFVPTAVSLIAILDKAGTSFNFLKG